ncbi:hypothetical protein TNCV_4614871 [Trichonephila clavipes]|nr:hypothetical protein TNCV_4614871 [Trichonephila clavipes]
MVAKVFAMVWWGVSYEDVSEVHFCQKGVQLTAKIYLNNIIRPIGKPLDVNENCCTSGSTRLLTIRRRRPTGD